MSWTPPVHVLLSPITADDQSQIEQIPLKPLFYAAQKDALARAGDDEDDQFFELARLATGLSVKELDQLKRPDYVSIAQYVHEMSTRPAAYFLQQIAEDAASGPVPTDDPDQVQLLQPLNVAGRSMTSLTLEMPVLRATKAMKKLKTAKERAEFITAHCTGLMLPDLGSLTVPDWTQLQVRIDDFLNKPAAFFRSATSK
ncbi:MULTISPECIES: phage tail assembly protein [unclassified Pseudomonas]|uniref:phage tail assembly protein n=1 Tax=unclassified Pseudomonas TaxID=196821 RepID=UPI002AC918B1|nr:MULTISPECIES: phage tail assembly protein [unclassified Pseudomonas]MEB0045752.1 phage tail assembly protein [Pseudomonas sp. Dout3]MEB0098145.1 phage tail assembly protein [Pseudomonas sp. DC1.2]WPX60123.1 phage tail assembly protein [Pseudomonas sp. DC1.2]